MAAWDLPTTVDVGGVERAIRTDFRAVLDVMQVMADPEIDGEERALVALSVFYPDLEDIPQGDLEEAVRKMNWFVAGGEEERAGRPKRPRVMDWEQDFPLIIAPVNHVLGYDARAVPYDAQANEGGLHWWTFLAAYREIGDCTFAQVVAIRRKRAAGKRLDKADERFYRDNRDLVDLRRVETEQERALFDEWIGG